MRRKITMILALLLMLAGLGVLTYPVLSDYISRRNGSYAIQLLDNRMEGIQEKVLERQRELAAEYNARLGAGKLTDWMRTMKKSWILVVGSWDISGSRKSG